MSVFTVSLPPTASAFTLMALGLAAGVSGAGAILLVLAVAIAATGAGATVPLGKMASSLAGAAGAAAAGAAGAGVWAWAAAEAKALATISSNIFFITRIRARKGKIACVKLSNSGAAFRRNSHGAGSGGLFDGKPPQNFICR